MKCMTVNAIFYTRRSIYSSERRELRFLNRLGDYRRHTGRNICTKFGGKKNKLGLPNRARLEHQLVLTKSAKSATKKKLGLQKVAKISKISIFVLGY